MIKNKLTIVLLMFSILIVQKPVHAQVLFNEIDSSCTFSVEDVSNNVSTLLDFEEVGYSKSTPIPKDDFEYTKKIKHISFLSQFGLTNSIAGYLSQIHHKSPDFAEHLLERILWSKVVASENEDFVNSQTCLQDMIRLETPLDTKNRYVILPVGLVTSKVSTQAPNLARSVYFVNLVLFRKLNLHNRMGMYFSLLIRDYLQISNAHYGNRGLQVRNLVSTLISELKLKDFQYLQKIENIMSQIDSGGLLYWTSNYSKSFSWTRNRCFNNSELSCAFSPGRPVGGYFYFERFPKFKYTTFDSKKKINENCRPIEENLKKSLVIINSSLDTINKYIQNLVLAGPRSCELKFIDATIDGFLLENEYTFCDSDAVLDPIFHFNEFEGFLRNGAYLTVNPTHIFEESGFGYGGGIFKKIVRIKYSSGQILNFDLSKIIDWTKFKSSADVFSRSYNELSQLEFQCQNINYTDTINLRNLKVDL